MKISESQPVRSTTNKQPKWIMLRQIQGGACMLGIARPARIAELPCSKFDPELFPHSEYVEIFVTFATKVPYLTFCNKM